MSASPDVYPRASVTGLVLAGGRGTRMGGQDKGRLPYRGTPLVEWVIAAVAPQVGALLISANRHLDVYAAYGYPVLPDGVADFPGPLAGVLAGWAASTTEWLLVVPCDTPHLPPDLAQRLYDAARAADAPLAVATDGTHEHHGCFIVHRELRANLAAYFARGERAVHRWHAQHPRATAVFNPAQFTNFNTPNDLVDAPDSAPDASSHKSA